MYIDPFLAGVLCTIGVELIMLVVGAILYGIKRKDDNQEV